MQLVKAGTTDVSTTIFIFDSTDGSPETGVDYDTSGIDLWYWRFGSTKTSITEATLASLDAAHSDGGIEHCANGEYRLDLPDAACASGAKYVLVGGTVTGMIVIGQLINLTAIDPFDAVRMGMTALPNAAADAAGGLPISDAGALDLDAKIGALTFTVAGDVDVNVQSWKGAAAADMTGDAYARLGAPAGASVSADVAAVKSDTAAVLVDTATDGVVVAAGSKTGYSLAATTGLGNQTANITGNLTGSVGSVTGAVGSVTGNVGGNVTGSVGSVTAIANGAITAAAIADNAIDAATFASDVDAEIATMVWNAAAASYGGAGTYGQAVEDILTDTAEIGSAGAGLTAVPWNSAWDAEVQSEVFDALDAAFTDATSLTSNGLLDRIRTLMWIQRNKIDVDDASGTTKIYKDDNSTVAFQSPDGITNMLTDDSTTTTRLRAA